MVKNLPANAGGIRDTSSIPGSGRTLEKKPTPVFLPGESHGQRSLAGVKQDLVIKQQYNVSMTKIAIVVWQNDTLPG